MITRPTGDNSQSESNRENNNRMNQTMNEFMGDSPPHYMIWNDKGKLIKKSEEISNDHFISQRTLRATLQEFIIIYQIKVKIIVS